MASAVPSVVLIIVGNDPSGGAGLTADTQAVTALGAHPAPVVTSLTVQDTVNAYRVESVAAELVAVQAETVLQDLPVAAIKLGLLAKPVTGEAVAKLLRQHAGIPVVLDPVLVAALLSRGVQHVLIKGADEDMPEVKNILYSQGQSLHEFIWPRLAGVYHGSDCTPASAIAALLATGTSVPQAVSQAQTYTWNSLQRGWQLGHGQKIPNCQAAA